jgi:hypothetical protein
MSLAFDWFQYPGIGEPISISLLNPNEVMFPRHPHDADVIAR